MSRIDNLNIEYLNDNLISRLSDFAFHKAFNELTKNYEIEEHVFKFISSASTLKVILKSSLSEANKNLFVDFLFAIAPNENSRNQLNFLGLKDNGSYKVPSGTLSKKEKISNDDIMLLASMMTDNSKLIPIMVKRHAKDYEYNSVFDILRNTKELPFVHLLKAVYEHKILKNALLKPPAYSEVPDSPFITSVCDIVESTFVLMLKLSVEESAGKIEKEVLSSVIEYVNYYFQNQLTVNTLFTSLSFATTFQNYVNSLLYDITPDDLKSSIYEYEVNENYPEFMKKTYLDMKELAHREDVSNLMPKIIYSFVGGVILLGLLTMVYFRLKSPQFINTVPDF
ncbi:hypothetical protein ROZALSC1DRAFT_29143 [Rozella allomycis CSF55]|uniref:Uncharacterized protein n=1 Tax=Rozella allomycis (strain CSF55) TaxID=988480 RepID=A0A4P9YI44_ROZAC|nr:hypothetical protein ROZALSC1DRAFT_29143 [Rozella allomycis CSF55]